MNICPTCGVPAAGASCSACGYESRLIGGFRAYAPELANEAPGYDPRHYEMLARLESGNFWFRARNALILHAFGKYFPGSGRYLEVGCGTGFVLSAISDAFPALEVSGSEIFVEGLSFAVQRAPRAKLFQMDARSIPFAATFDVIGAFDVLEHIEDDTHVMSELRKALRPGGGLIVTVPQHSWLWSVQDDIAHHVRRYAPGEMERKLAGSGFEVRWSSSFVSLLMPALMLSRMTARKTVDDASDPFREFNIPGWLNWILLSIMGVERALIKIGIRFPLGGSRIVVAFKKAEQ